MISRCVKGDNTASFKGSLMEGEVILGISGDVSIDLKK